MCGLLTTEMQPLNYGQEMQPTQCSTVQPTQCSAVWYSAAHTVQCGTVQPTQCSVVHAAHTVWYNTAHTVWYSAAHTLFYSAAHALHTRPPSYQHNTTQTAQMVLHNTTQAHL